MSALRARRVGLGLLWTVPTLIAGCDLGPAEPGPDATEILWDRYGIPHIYGETTEDLFFAHGWAQMEAHGDLLLRLYGESRGRAAEYEGPERLPDDRLVRTLGLPGLGEEWYEAQEPDARRRIDAFARGINAYAREHADRIGEAVSPVLPVEPQDVLRHVARLLVGDFVLSGWQGAAGLWREGSQPAPSPASGAPGTASNVWGVGASHSVSGNALLLANPHLPWGDRFTLFEVHLVGPGLDLYGTTLVGLPLPVIAFNDHLGWSHTVNTQRGWDLYELELAGGGYLWDGEPRDFQMDTTVLSVREGTGGHRSDTIVIRSSVHGPVVERLGRRALALRHVGPEMSDVLGQWWEMGVATSLEEFEHGVSRGGSPSLTVTYADREGNILHHSGGLAPRRPEWRESYWTEPLPGTSSGTLWTEVHPYEEMPRVLNPVSGWVQNANEAPWTNTVPGAPSASDYPPYFARAREIPLRAQLSIHLIQEGPVSLEELVERKHSTRVLLAERVLPDLLAAAEDAPDPVLTRALRVLEEWDRRVDAESTGAILFQDWADSWIGRSRTEGGASPFARPWTPDAPLETPAGIADPELALEILAGSARIVEGRLGSLDVPWGEMHRIRRDGQDLPGDGASEGAGVFRVVTYAPGGDGRMEAVGGDSFVMAVELSDPVRAVALLAYGNASQAGSVHRSDQLELFSRGELRPVWRDRETIEANLTRRTTF